MLTDTTGIWVDLLLQGRPQPHRVKFRDLLLHSYQATYPSSRTNSPQLRRDPNKMQTAEFLICSGKMQLLHEMGLSNASHRHIWKKNIIHRNHPIIFGIKKENVKIAWSYQNQVKGN